MRLATYPIYTFAELSEGAKDKARAWFREGNNDYAWWSEAKASLDNFARYFGIKLTDFSIGAYSYSYVETDVTPQHFRGRKVKDVPERDYMPTGYSLDATLWGAFHDSLEEHKKGDMMQAFKDAMDAGVKDIVADMEYQDCNEAVDEAITINEYEFYEDGTRAH